MNVESEDNQNVKTKRLSFDIISVMSQFIP